MLHGESRPTFPGYCAADRIATDALPGICGPRPPNPVALNFGSQKFAAARGFGYDERAANWLDQRGTIE
jgi:hypothetical protein